MTLSLLVTCIAFKHSTLVELSAGRCTYSLLRQRFQDRFESEDRCTRFKVNQGYKFPSQSVASHCHWLPSWLRLPGGCIGCPRLRVCVPLLRVCVPLLGACLLLPPAFVTPEQETKEGRNRVGGLRRSWVRGASCSHGRPCSYSRPCSSGAGCLSRLLWSRQPDARSSLSRFF